ncbi:hypothetical protein L210DRAFT_3653236 [Boletus edulis BED1]|uniref:CHAT domain-containing protein n=1 Tax=Boletus edulis BED1 TaxID=1328754 RepID=A0AAD4BF45_BOLED|nr:hypothetical protein L210DRAFT_3653236 [Boletus edulis BED1]
MAVGSAAIQVAKRFNAKVFATVGKRHGVDEFSSGLGIPISNIVLIDDLFLVAAEWIRSGAISQFDVIFNGSGKKAFAHGLEYLSPFGSYVHIQSDEAADIPSGAASSYLLDVNRLVAAVLIPPLEHTSNLLGADLRAWYDEMPKTTTFDEQDPLAHSPRKRAQLGMPFLPTTASNQVLASMKPKVRPVHSRAKPVLARFKQISAAHRRSKPEQLRSLGESLVARFHQLGVTGDLDEAVIFGREALELCPQGHPDRSTGSLGSYLLTRYNQPGAMADLDEAIILGREALALCPQGHPDRSTSLNNLAVHPSTRYHQLGLRPQGHPHRSSSLEILASTLYTLFMQLREPDDGKSLFNLYALLVDAPQLVAEEFQHPSTLLAYETSLRFLIHRLTTFPPLPQHPTILKECSSSLAVDAFSACLRRGAPVRGVELLEQGHSVFWSQLSRLLTISRHLVQQEGCWQSLIRIALSSPENYHQYLGVAWLLSFPSSLALLRYSPCRQWPVIIVNASRYGCDALAVLLDRDPIHIPLQVTYESVRDLSAELHASTERAKKVDVTRELGSLLCNLWDQWCPIAEFSVLPLHAAGPYRKGEQNLSDLYISSYTPTLSALILARRPAPSNTSGGGKRFVAIGQANAIGQIELPSVGTELANMGQRIGGLASFTQIEGPQCCISWVAEEIGKTEWVYLACHGLANRSRPFESVSTPHDGRFTIQRIMRYKDSPDEVIHLAAAMQFAGFRSVIGTTRAVDDAETNKIMSTFYKHMADESGSLDHTRAAFTLNKTMKSVDVPLDQRILYIHIGA